MKAAAEAKYLEGSFSQAQEIYRGINWTNLPSAESRWVEFRLADTAWRAEAQSQNADTTRLDQARDQLESLLRRAVRDDDRDQIWAEAQESMGDFFWTRRNLSNWGEAWLHYQAALDWWAESSDLETARQHYLAIVWRAVRPPHADPNGYGYWGNSIPLEVLENALKIAQTDLDKAHAHFLLAMNLRNVGGPPAQGSRVPEEFEGALKPGKSADWYDDALYFYAQWMASQGRSYPLENGGWRIEADYAKALTLFRRLVSEYSEGESRYWNLARQQIAAITEPSVGVSVPNIFLPDSEIQYFLTWRNVQEVRLTLYPVELNRDVALATESQSSRDWLSSIKLDGREQVKSWTFDPNGRSKDDSGTTNDYAPGSATLHVDGRLRRGAYVLEAVGGGKRARDLVLVTDGALVLKTSGRQALVYACNALDSAPLAECRVKLWESWWDNGRWHCRSQEKTAGADGTAVFDLLTERNGSRSVFASAIRQDIQAFAVGDSYGNSRDSSSWRIYAFTDRPAYRPEDTVNWKVTARQYDGSAYTTPSGTTVAFEITDPRGAKVKSDTLKLNSFGSGWGQLALTDKMPLGEYTIIFSDAQRHEEIGRSTLFRLEEYKLPEFKVSVQTPQETNAQRVAHRKIFRLGDAVQATIQADYYFGGPVSGAGVEVLVHQRPFWHGWQEPRPYPWLYQDLDRGYGGWQRNFGGDQIVKRETLKTDAEGKATITFDTPAHDNQDYEYQIEARVTDASRREINGVGTVRVTRQGYFVYPKPDHNLYRPQDRVTVGFKALDANEQPVQATGTVKVTRDYWYEIWRAPDGREVKGDELKRLQTQARIWPPPPTRPDQKDWRLKFQGYEHDEILTRTLTLDTNGEAELSFTPERDGYYRIAWSSPDDISNFKSQISNSGQNSNLRSPIPNPIQADATVWVCSGRTTELGYRQGGVEIIADKDTFRVGQKAPVMLVTPTADRYVLFTVEGEDLYDHQVVHMDGTVKLLELPITEKHVPNIFLSAALVTDRQVFTDNKAVIVPPTRNFLTVDLKADHDQYQPREEGTLTVTTRDDQGKPVSAEVAIGLVDDAVYAIQQDYAGDPREFFFGAKRGQLIQTQATMNQKSYAKLIEWTKGVWIDERDQKQMEQQSERALEAGTSSVDNAGFVTYGIGGGGGGSVVQGMYLADRLQANKAYTVNAPIPATRAVRDFDRRAGDLSGVASAGEAAAEVPEMPVQVRSDFRASVFWQPDVLTDKDGKATVPVKYPDSLTTWKATARGVTAANQFGIAEDSTRTQQPLIVRLEAPRFFVVGDTVTLSTVVNNHTDQPMTVTVSLEAAGGLKIQPGADQRARDVSPLRRLEVPANGEARADWTASVVEAGTVKLKATGRAAKFADAMEKNFTVYEHGIEKFIAKSGKARGSDFAVKLDLPSERRPGSTTLTVQLTPSLAVTMLDALPYLINYPYGCTEQTMSRFLPAAITAHTLEGLGIAPEEVFGRVFGGIETNSAAATHPDGKRSLDDLRKVIQAGQDRLRDFQHADGGWGWWKEGSSDHWMTAYVVWGLSLAEASDVASHNRAAMLRRAAAYLDKALVEEEDAPDMQAWMLYALAEYHESQKSQSTTMRESAFQKTAFENLWKNRAQLNAYTRSLLALTAHTTGRAEQARILVENLENGIQVDDRPDNSVLLDPARQSPASAGLQSTAHWGEEGIYWRWSDGGVEATAFALRAMLAIDPTNKLVEPVTTWLIRNRRGAQWNSTRDTAIAVLALNDYLRLSGELNTDTEFELEVNGRSIAKRTIRSSEVFQAPSRFEIPSEVIRDNNLIRIKTRNLKSGSTNPAVYFAVEGRFFSKEEPIPPAGNEIFVRRDYFKQVGRPTLLKGYVYERQPLRDGDSVRSGDRVESVLTIEAKNDYEYLMFEDLKPAGFEAAEIRSGESLYARELKESAIQLKYGTNAPPAQPTPPTPAPSMPRRQKILSSGAGVAMMPHARPSPDSDYTGRTRWVYQELRDRKVALFLDKLPQGTWQMEYEFRAEVPGHFHALPVVGQAMYVPEIRANSAEERVTVVEDTAPSAP